MKNNHTHESFLDCTCWDDWFSSAHGETPCTIWHARTRRLFVGSTRLLTLRMDKMMAWRWSANCMASNTIIAKMLASSSSSSSSATTSPTPYCSILVIETVHTLFKVTYLNCLRTTDIGLYWLLKNWPYVYYRMRYTSDKKERIHQVDQEITNRQWINWILFAEENFAREWHVEQALLPRARATLQTCDRHPQPASHLVWRHPPLQ